MLKLLKLPLIKEVKGPFNLHKYLEQRTCHLNKATYVSETQNKKMEHSVDSLRYNNIAKYWCNVLLHITLAQVFPLLASNIITCKVLPRVHNKYFFIRKSINTSINV